MYRTLSLTIKPLIALIVSALLLTGCSTSQIVGSWSEPGLAAGGFQNVLVIGVANDDMVKRIYEDTMVARLKQKGIQASPSYRIVKRGEKVERDVIINHLKRNNMDGVMVTKLIGKRTETVVTPAQTTVRTGGHRGDYYGGRRGGYDRWYPHYAASYDVAHTPSTVQSYEVLTIESTLYKIQGDQEQPTWSAQSETAPSGNINSDVSELVDKLFEDMADQGIL